MCSFATRSDHDFSQAILSFVKAQAGLIAPQPGRTHFNLSPTRGDAPHPRPDAAGEPVGGSSLVAAGRHSLSAVAAVSAETRAAAGDPQPLVAQAKPAAATAFDANPVRA